ncbi:MAG: choice-of-anchor P family protein [Gemmatimonadales bacterium]
MAGNAQSVSGRAYGAYVNTPTASLDQSPLAVLPDATLTGGEMATASADAVSVSGTVSSEFLNSTTTGAIGTAVTTAQSTATVADINILSGLITAQEVIAVAASGRDGTSAWSNSYGSTFEDLVVNGVAVTTGDAAVAPNTRIDVPGVGYVVLNEQVRTGDGVSSSGITVNMIHVVLESTVTDLLGGTTTTKTGDIIVGSASSAVR